jgi:hypothetical protein
MDNEESFIPTEEDNEPSSETEQEPGWSAGSSDITFKGTP